MTTQPKKLSDQVRETIRRKHCSIRTEQAHVRWVMRYEPVSIPLISNRALEEWPDSFIQQDSRVPSRQGTTLAENRWSHSEAFALNSKWNTIAEVGLVQQG